MIVGVKTDKSWMNDIAKIPILGAISIFLIIFIVPVLCSFLCQSFVQELKSDIGFTKALMVLLPGWNLALWFLKIKTFIFFMPAWALLGGLAVLRGIRLLYE